MYAYWTARLARWKGLSEETSEWGPLREHGWVADRLKNKENMGTTKFKNNQEATRVCDITVIAFAKGWYHKQSCKVCFFYYFDKNMQKTFH